jgi:hypothetical protein
MHRRQEQKLDLDHALTFADRAPTAGEIEGEPAGSVVARFWVAAKRLRAIEARMRRHI